MGSIQIAPSVTEIDYVPQDVRLAVGDVLLTAALIQQQLADLFAVMTGVNPSVFVYLGHRLDTSQTITALKRLVKSDDAPMESSPSLPNTLTRCAKALEERNKIAHYPLMYVDDMLLRMEVRGGDNPHRIAQSLRLGDFLSLLQEMKSVLWELRTEVAALQKRSRTL